MNISTRIKRLLFTLGILLGFWTMHAQEADPYYDYYETLQNTTISFQLPSSLNQNVYGANNGTYSWNGNILEYTPNNGYIGTDSLYGSVFEPPFTTHYFFYEISVLPSIVTAKDDYEVTLVNTAATIDVLPNDVTTASGLYVKDAYLVNHGTGTLDINTDLLTFTPETDFEGIAYIGYTACDGFDICDKATIAVRVNPATLTSSAANYQIGKNRTLAVVLPDDNFTLSQGPSNGQLQQENGLVYIYSPNSNFNGLDSFTFADPSGSVVFDGQVTVHAVADPNLYAIPDVAYLNTTESSVAIDVLANDVGNALSPNSVQVTSGPSYGSTSISNGIVTYTPNPGFYGVDRFIYRARTFYYYWEYAEVSVVVSNHRPYQTTFDLNTPINTPKVLSYSVPFDAYNFTIDAPANFGEIIYYPGDTTLNLNGQTISGYNLLVYYPDQDFFTETFPDDIDEFELSYCVGTDCSSIKVNITVEDMTPPNGSSFCIGPDCVWPGDANNDGITDWRDVLPIGMYAGYTGDERANASTNWYGQEANEWNSFYRNYNPKFLDTDGDGFIAQGDLDVIHANYLRQNDIFPEVAAVEKLGLYFNLIPNNDTLQPGDLLQIEFGFGPNGTPEVDLYGFGFSFNYFSDYFVDSTANVVMYDDSWFSHYNPLIRFAHQPYDGRIDIASSRTDGVAAIGAGEVGAVYIITDDFIGVKDDGETVLRLKFEDVYSVDAQGIYTKWNDLDIELPIVFAQENANTISEKDVFTFPNPAHEQVRIKVNGNTEIQRLEMYAASGQLVTVLADPASDFISVDVSTLPAGLYIVQVHTGKGTVSKKVQVSR